VTWAHRVVLFSIFVAPIQMSASCCEATEWG